MTDNLQEKQLKPLKTYNEPLETYNEPLKTYNESPTNCYKGKELFIIQLFFSVLQALNYVEIVSLPFTPF